MNHTNLLSFLRNITSYGASQSKVTLSVEPTEVSLTCTLSNNEAAQNGTSRDRHMFYNCFSPYFRPKALVFRERFLYGDCGKEVSAAG